MWRKPWDLVPIPVGIIGPRIMSHSPSLSSCSPASAGCDQSGAVRADRHAGLAGISDSDVFPAQRLYLCVLPRSTVQTIMTHFGLLDLHARSVPARVSGGEERMGFRLLIQRFGRQVDAAGPDDRPGLRINRDLSEVGGII